MTTLWPSRSFRSSSWRRKQKDDTRAPSGLAIALVVSLALWATLLVLLWRVTHG